MTEFQKYEYGCIAEHLTHSYSKDIHKVIGDYRYDYIELEDSELKKFFSDRNFEGINVTIPYKSRVIPLLDETDIDAMRIGAVNTVVNKDGRLIGYNTDYQGLICLFEHYNIEISNRNVMILGSGGTAHTAAVAVKALGAERVDIVSRNPVGSYLGYDAAKSKTDVNVLINTTPVGMYPQYDKISFDISGFDKLEAVVDVIYNPIRTDLIAEAQKRNIKAVGGLYMLSSQAVKSAEHFFDCEFDKSKTEQVYNKVYSSKRNICLIGMPSCGKSTIGRKLSKLCSMPFIDTDEEIEKEIKMPISEYFEKLGEPAFRKKEERLIEKLQYQTGTVISCGGGVVLNYENIRRLKHNGTLVWISRDINMLTPTDSRPLFSSKEQAKKLFCEREPIYRQSSDIIFDINENESIEENAERLRNITEVIK